MEHSDENDLEFVEWLKHEVKRLEAENAEVLARALVYRADMLRNGAERDRLAAVIEQARTIIREYPWTGLRYALENTHDGPLSSVPTDTALRERHAEKWDEGFEGFGNGAVNPYREEANR